MCIIEKKQSSQKHFIDLLLSLWFSYCGNLSEPSVEKVSQEMSYYKSCTIDLNEIKQFGCNITLKVFSVFLCLKI